MVVVMMMMLELELELEFLDVGSGTRREPQG
jgi:hypothetical protein